MQQHNGTWIQIMRTRYGRHGHAVSWIHVHLVFCTKYRRKVITQRVFHTLKRSMVQTALALRIDLCTVESEGDHIHILLRYPPQLALSSIVQRLTGAASHAVRSHRFPEVLRRLWGAHFWSAGWFAVSCGGAPLATIRQYIQQQTPYVSDPLPTQPTAPPQAYSSDLRSARSPNHGLKSIVSGEF